MDATEIREEMLPFYRIESNAGNGWHKFSYEPFATEGEAIAHMEKIVEAYPQLKGMLRVAEYTKEDWVQDLANLVLMERDDALEALATLEPEVLLHFIQRRENAVIQNY